MLTMQGPDSAKRHAESTPMGCEGNAFAFCLLAFTSLWWVDLLCPWVRLIHCYYHCCCQNSTSSTFQGVLKTIGSTGVLQSGRMRSHSSQLLQWMLPLFGLSRLYHVRFNKFPFNTHVFPWFCPLESSNTRSKAKPRLSPGKKKKKKMLIVYLRILSVYCTAIQKLHQIRAVTKGGAKTRTLW